MDKLLKDNLQTAQVPATNYTKNTSCVIIVIVITEKLPSGQENDQSFNSQIIHKLTAEYMQIASSRQL